MEIIPNKAIVLGGTKNQIFAIGTLIINLQKVCSLTQFRIIVFYDSIYLEDRKIFESFSNVELHQYNFPRKLKKFIPRAVLRNFTEMVFCKLECFNLLNHYEQVIWLDYDIIVLKDVLKEFSLLKNGIHILKGSNTQSLKSQFLKTDKILNYDLDQPALAAGTFVLNKDLRIYNDMYKWSYDLIKTVGRDLRMPEQGLMQLTFQKFNITLNWLDSNRYALHPNKYNSLKEKNSVSILHAFGHPKFWNGIEIEEFQSNYNQWIKSGGTKFIGWNYKYLNRKFWTILNIIMKKIAK